jgi:iron-sulfur cluster assembly accessory protein
VLQSPALEAFFWGMSDLGGRCYDSPVATVEQPTLVTLTESAASKIRDLMAEEPEGEAAVLRIAVQGGGCSGFQYALGFDRGAQEGDNELHVEGVDVVVDPFSAPYLAGTEIDWVEGLQAGFAINNPNVSASCGCGHSFQVEEGEEAPEGAAGCGSGCSH